MKLLTDKIKEVLPELYSTEDVPCDEKEIIVRFFNPLGNQTWEIAEGSEQEDGDWLFFGLCDLGFGMGEWGNVSLRELESIQLSFGMGIERDICSGEAHYHPEWAAM